MQIIKEISTWDTYPVRNPVLRPGKPIESCRFDGDDLPSTKHFGLFEDAELAAVATILESSSDIFDAQKQFQLRGMAVLESHQRKGLGEKILKAAEDYAKKQLGELVWFNAREIATEFYQRNGYEKAGNIFEIPGVGPHYVMYKFL